MAAYRVVFQDSGKDTRRSDTSYIRVRILKDDRYVGVWFGLLNGRSKLRHLSDPDDARHYESMAPIALARAIQDAVASNDFAVPRDVPLHPTSVLTLTPEQHVWVHGDEVMTFEA
jgi:hypothetical protein